MSIKKLVLITIVVFYVLGSVWLITQACSDSIYYTKILRYARKAVYTNAMACSCVVVPVDDSNNWWEEDSTTITYTSDYEFRYSDSSTRRMRLEVKYFKINGAFSSTFLDLSNPPKIRLGAVGVE